MGRPPLPKSEAKYNQVGVRFNPKENRQLDQIARRSGQTRAEAVRAATLYQIESPPIWVKSKWKREELDGKLVEFKLTAPGRELSGVGHFQVLENTRGEIAIDIFIDEHPSPYEGVLTRIWLAQDAVDKIELNPKPEPAPFRLVG
jgi:hypothetical protein